MPEVATSAFLQNVCVICLTALLISGCMCVYRIIIGPKAAERAVALDTLTSVVIGVICALCIMWKQTFYFDAVWILTLVGFLGSAVIAKYLEKGRVF